MDYFSEKELQCPCCKTLIFDSSFLFRLNHARRIAGIPFIVSSGYRCRSHNRTMGGTASSSHLKGLAVDIATRSSRERFKVFTSLVYAGLHRFGIGSDFIHVDNDPDKDPEVIWTYYPEEDI